MDEVGSFALRLKRHRARAHLTQEELAERAGLSVRTISDLERGLKRARGTTIQLLAEALALSDAEHAALEALARNPRDVRSTSDPGPLPPEQSVDVSSRSVAVHTTAPALPLILTPFVGRTQEVAEVRERLLGEVRLVTLTGAGGTGKTRLAIQVAQQLRSHFSDGVVFVALATWESPSLVPMAVQQAVGLAEIPGRSPLQTIAGYISGKRLLFVLDIVEHVLDAASFIGDLLENLPALKVLATSRVPLRLYREHGFRVPPLALPEESGDSIGRSDAVQLFVQRAQASRPDFALTPENSAAVVEVCRRLDGLPLALELAAARIKLFSPSALLSRLDSRLGLLVGGPRNLPERHQTLRKTLDWSYHLLSPEGRRCFSRLGVFAGDFDVVAAGVICDVSPEEMLDSLEHLAEQSLLEVMPDAPEPRFRMLQTVREYALDRLLETGEANSVYRLYADFYRNAAEQVAPLLIGPDQVEWLAWTEAEHSNFSAALGWLLDNDPAGALRTAIALTRFWERRGHLTEARDWFGAALRQPGIVDSLRAEAAVAAAPLFAASGDFDLAEDLLAEAEAIFERSDNLAGLAAARSARGEVAFLAGDVARSCGAREEACGLYRQVGDPWGQAMMLYGLGATCFWSDDPKRAGTLLAESEALFREVGDLWGIAATTLHLAGVHAFGGAFEQGLASGRETLRRWLELSDGAMTARALMGVGLLTAGAGDARAGGRLYAAGEAWLERFGYTRIPAHQAYFDELLERSGPFLDRAEFERGRSEGCLLPIGDAIRDVLS